MMHFQILVLLSAEARLQREVSTQECSPRFSRSCGRRFWGRDRGVVRPDMPRAEQEELNGARFVLCAARVLKHLLLPNLNSFPILAMLCWCPQRPVLNGRSFLPRLHSYPKNLEDSAYFALLLYILSLLCPLSSFALCYRCLVFRARCIEQL